MNKLNVVYKNDILSTCKGLHLVRGDIHEINVFQEVGMLQNISENCTGVNALKDINCNNLSTEIYSNMITDLKMLLKTHVKVVSANRSLSKLNLIKENYFNRRLVRSVFLRYHCYQQKTKL